VIVFALSVKNMSYSAHRGKKEFSVILDLLKRYCAFQERTSADVELKGMKEGLGREEIENALETLKEQGFLDENRYVTAFVSGKLNHNKWGKNKIRAELKSKRMNEELIADALELIDDVHYEEVLKTLLKKKAVTFQGLRDEDTKVKLLRYALSKGFEYEKVFIMVNEILKA